MNPKNNLQNFEWQLVHVSVAIIFPQLMWQVNDFLTKLEVSIIVVHIECILHLTIIHAKATANHSCLRHNLIKGYDNFPQKYRNAD